MRRLWPRLLLLAYAALVLAFLVAPILAIVPLSFNAGSFLTYPLDGLSLRWYAEVLTTERWLRALGNSLIIAVPATALALVLGTFAAVGLAQARIRGKAVITGLLISPMIVPTIIAAVGMYFFFAPLGLVNSFPGLILAHAALGAPFVFVTVSATLATFDTSLVRAAASLGAPPAAVFRRVTLPLMIPGLVATCAIVFLVSFDEVVISLFLVGPQLTTLPVALFRYVETRTDPLVAAVSTLLVVFSLAIVLVLDRAVGLRRAVGK